MYDPLYILYVDSVEFSLYQCCHNQVKSFLEQVSMTRKCLDHPMLTNPLKTCPKAGDKYKSKTLFLAIFYSRSLII